MSYDEFLNDILERAEETHPMYFDKSKRACFKRILEISSEHLFDIVDSLTNWSWYTPSPLKAIRLAMTGGVIAIVIKLLCRYNMLNQKGIKATLVFTEITQEYKSKFYSCNNNITAIKDLKEMAYNDMISRI